MKIVYCIPTTYYHGGIERVLANKVNALIERGYDVYIVTTDQMEKKPYFSMRSEITHIDLAVNYYNHSRWLIAELFNYFHKRYLHRKRLSKLLITIKPDITISMFHHEKNFLPTIKDGSKKICEFHFCKQWRIDKTSRGLRHLWNQYWFSHTEQVLQTYDKFVLLTERDRRDWNMPNSLVIPNSSTFKTAMAGSTKRVKKAIAVGRLTYQKGFDLLIQIWEQVHTRIPDWQLEIIGSGELLSDLQNLIRKKGLQTSILLTPATHNIQEKYQEASMLLMTSRFEGLPMVLIEAQEYSLPVISFDCPCGPSDIIHHGINGFLISEGDLSDFADKIELLAHDDTLRHLMGIQGKKNAENFSEQMVMNQWEHLFIELTNQC